MTEAPRQGVAIDTNVLVYAEGEGDLARCTAAREMLAKLSAGSVMLPCQVLGELHRVLTRRGKRSAQQAREAVLGWADAFDVRDSSWPAMQAAMDLQADHQFQIWDALVLAVTAEHRCRILLSEDMQHGFTWRGVTIVNPFAEQSHPLLQQMLYG